MRGDDVVVVGGGVIGLSVAHELLARGHRVRVWRRDDPAQTVSAVAGAIWYPFLAEPRARVLAWSAVTFRRLAASARDAACGVTMQPVVERLATVPSAPPWWAEAVGGVDVLPREQLPPGCVAALRTVVPVCTTPVYLPWLERQVTARGGRIERREVRDLAEALAAAPCVVNCTGLGARELCGDGSLRAVRGQVLLADPVPGVTALIDDDPRQPFYVIPRGGDLVLGGTAQPGDERAAPDDADSAAILAGLAARVPALARPRVRQVRVGLRPWRPTVRLEAEARGGGVLVHCYGHGGSGYTLAWGCAVEVADLLAG